MARHMIGAGIWMSAMAFVFAHLASACFGCDAAGCLAGPVLLELVDDANQPVLARGEVRITHHGTDSFDCVTAEDAEPSDIECDGGTLTLEPLYNPDDQIEIRFQANDGWTDWEAVELQVRRRVFRDFNGPGCDCDAYQGTTSPVTVPEEARLSDG